MSDPLPESEPGPPRPRGKRLWPRLLLGVAALAILLLITATTLYLKRRAVAEALLAGWLERRGLESEVVVERIGRTGLAARIRLGEAADPQLAIERVEADYVIGMPWSAQGFALELGRVRLLRPVLKAGWRDGKFGLGPLDPLLREFLAAPARPGRRRPLVIVEAGELKLDTDFGALRALGDARIEEGRMVRLAARVPAAQIKGAGIEAQGLAATLNMATTGERMVIHLVAAVDGFSHATAQGESARLNVTADMPYPDLEARRVAGPLAITADLTAAQLHSEAGQAREAHLHAAFDGEGAGDVAALRMTGPGRLDLTVSTLDGEGMSLQDLQAALPDARLEVVRGAQGLGWSVQSASSFAVRRFKSGELAAQGLAAALQLDVAGEAGLDALRLRAEGSMQAARGSWPLLGAAAADDAPEMAAMKRALRAFSVRVPGMRLAAGPEGTSLRLTQAARVTPATGGRLVLAPLTRPAYEVSPGQRAGGALRVVATRGPGVPEATFNVPDWHLTGKGFEARVDGMAALDFEPVQGLRIETRGVLVLNGEHLSYSARDCARLSVERVELQDNDVTALAGTLCPDGAPLFSSANGSWKMQGRFSGVSAEAPSVAVRLADVQGGVTARGSPQGVALEATVTGGRASDTMLPARFNPVSASGSAALQDERWSGAFQLSSGARPIGRMTLDHDAARATGGVRIQMPELVFAEGGLQPADLSPLAASYVQPPARGSIRFEGWINWAGEGGSSGGRLIIPGLDFTSPAGPVKGLKGDIQFTSLTPLVTAPDQRLSVDRLVAATEVTGLNVVFALDAGTLRIGGGEVHTAQGRMLALPFAMPLDLTQPFSGAVVLEKLQLGKVIADSGISDKFSLDAVVSGRLPFVWTPGQGVRIVGGSLAAVQPGRLALRREVLAQVETSSGAQVPPGLVEDLAYQAMENLAFDALSVDVNSLDGGRVGLVFRMKGRHNPPQRQRLRVGLMELISRRFLQRKLPLPSDTRIDLTLDVTLNLNELIADLLALNRARQGNGARPAPAAP